MRVLWGITLIALASSCVEIDSIPGGGSATPDDPSDGSPNDGGTSGQDSGGPSTAIPLDSSGWTAITPSSDTRVVYVSSTYGTDGGSCGSTPTEPCASVATGLSKLRAGFPDHLYFLRGDQWDNESFVVPDGRSQTERIVIGSYADAFGRTNADPRPKFNYHPSSSQWTRTPVIDGAAQSRAQLKYVMFTDLHFDSPWRDIDNQPSYTPKTYADFDSDFMSFANAPRDAANRIEHVLFEGVMFSHLTSIISQFHGDQSHHSCRNCGSLDRKWHWSRLNNFVFRRCVFHANYKSNGEARQIQFRGGHDILFEDNLFMQPMFYTGSPTESMDPASWASNENNHLVYSPDAVRNVYRNNVFWHGAGRAFLKHTANGWFPKVTNDNVIPDWQLPSSIGLEYDGNVFVAVGSSIMDAGGNNRATSTPRFADTKSVNNLVIAPGLESPWSDGDVTVFQFRDNEGPVAYDNNLVIWGSREQRPGDQRVRMYSWGNNRPVSSPSVEGPTFRNNIIHGLVPHGQGLTPDVGSEWIAPLVTGNVVHLTEDTREPMFDVPATPGGYFSDNHWHSVSSGSTWFSNGSYDAFASHPNVREDNGDTSAPVWADDGLTIEQWHEEMIGAANGDMKRAGWELMGMWQRFGPNGGWHALESTGGTAEDIQTYFRAGFTR